MMVYTKGAYAPTADNARYLRHEVVLPRLPQGRQLRRGERALLPGQRQRLLGGQPPPAGALRAAQEGRRGGGGRGGWR